MSLFKTILTKGADAVKTQPNHLPVLATISDSPFEINLSTKGIGVLPKKEQLHEITQSFIESVNSSDETHWSQTLKQRTETALTLYEDPTNFDPHTLGGLEIFEGKSHENLMRNPHASLLFTGDAPSYPSYQINCIAEIIGTKNPYYEFLLAARKLFAYDPFHIKQTKYPMGYLFHVVDVKNKTPYPRK